MTTDDPTAPVFGVRLVMPGADVTVNDTPALATPPAAVTTTLPEFAPIGTTAVMLVALQFVMVVAWVPPKLTNPLPCDGPKLEPASTMDDPTAPVLGVRLVMPGADVTVNDTPALATPPAAVTTTLPELAPVGTTAVMLVALQFVMVVAWVPPKLTNPLPCDGPKLEPAITMDDPTAPVLGVRLVMPGADVTVNDTPALATPPAAVTTTLPEFAPVGTTAVMLVALQLVMVVAWVPPKVTNPLPCDGPKFDPAITMDDPTAPVLGVRLLMVGAGVTVNVTPLLATPPTVTTTFPVVAVPGTTAVMLVVPQLLIVVAVTPLNFTVLEPCGEPKPLPAITTLLPTAPVAGVKLVTLTMVNGFPLLATLLTVTTTLPVVAPVGTVALIWVALQLVIDVAVVPLNFTVLVPWLEPKPR